MEPLAPGTEDDTDNNQIPTNSKKASEQQRLLSLKAYLPNRSYGRVFELTFPNGSEHWYCHLCECPVMGRVYHHEIGKRHTSRLQLGQKMHQMQGGPLEEDGNIQVAPGEPVPPGFEGKVQKIAEIQERLDNYHAGALLGLEYLLEIQEYDNDKEPSYLCLLCYKKGDPRTVIAHLASYNHLCQFLQRHFPTCYRALSPYMTKQYKRNWQIAVTKIAEAIESKYGRLKPFPVEKESFEDKKQYYWDLVNNGQHFTEKQGQTFEDLIDKEQLTKNLDGTAFTNADLKKRSPSPPIVARPVRKKSSTTPKKSRSQSLSSVSTISSSDDLSDFEPTPKRKSSDFRTSKLRSYRYNRSRSRSRSRSPPPYRHDRKGTNSNRDRLMPWQRSDYVRRTRSGQLSESSRKQQQQRNDSKYEEFKKLASAIENDMSKTLKLHERNPEKHPQYNDEWKVFWNKRYKELQNEGKDPNTFDFKPEWIQYWNRRIMELHNAEMKNRKEALRKRLGLPEEPAPICFRITGKRKANVKEDAPRKTNKPAPMASQPDQDHEVIIIEDKDEDTKSSKRSHSPWESDSGRNRSSGVSREKSRDRSRDSSWERYSPDFRRDRAYSSTERDYRRDYKRERSSQRSFAPDASSIHDRDHRFAYKKELLDCYKPPPVMRDVTRAPVFMNQMLPMTKQEEEPDDGDVNIVAVLRLLTALEEKLGSLGPKVIDLLAQALAMEKAEANSSETLLDNDINCVLFETVKEKLKGQLLAGLVDYTQEKAFKNAIKKIASLLHFASQRKKEDRKVASKMDPVKVAGIGAVDKAAIARQIATALVMQGKTDVTQSELEQLVNAVVGMAEAQQQQSNKQMSTESFIESLTKADIKHSNIGVMVTATAPPSAAPLQALQNANNDTTTSNMNHLSDSDLQTLLQNFKDLSNDEQHNLINYLKTLESTEPERVEKLRKFVNVGNEVIQKEIVPDNYGKISPFSSKLAQGDVLDDFGDDLSSPPHLDKKEEEHVSEQSSKITIIDSDEEDYSYEDVFQAATKNVTLKEEELRKQEETKKKDIDLFTAKTLIVNLMGNKNNNSGLTNETSSFNLAQTLNALPFDIENIVGKIQGFSQTNLSNNNAQSSQGNINNSKCDESIFNKYNSNNSHDSAAAVTAFTNLQNYHQKQQKQDAITTDFLLSNVPNVQYPQQYYNSNNVNSKSNFDNVSYPTTNQYSNNSNRQTERVQHFYNSRFRGGNSGKSRGNFNNKTNSNNNKFDGW